MDAPTLIDFPTVAGQILKISDVRKMENFTHHSQVYSKKLHPGRLPLLHGDSVDRHGDRTAKGRCVTKRLLSALDKFETEMLDGLPESVSDRRRHVFVEEFLKSEYAPG